MKRYLVLFVIIFFVLCGCKQPVEQHDIDDATEFIKKGRCTEGVNILKNISAVDDDAKYNLGVMYLKGTCVSKDLGKAYKYFLAATKNGHISSEFNLGIMFFNGDGVKKDMRKACSHFLEPARNGICRAQYLAGVCSEHGYYSNKNPIDYYKRASLCGDSDAMVRLSKYYIKGIFVKKNYNAAELLPREAYKKKNIDATYNLGVLYYNGYGVPKTVSKAISYFKEASRCGSGVASYSLYIIFRDGIGLPANNELADKYLAKSKEQGYSRH